MPLVFETSNTSGYEGEANWGGTNVALQSEIAQYQTRKGYDRAEYELDLSGICSPPLGKFECDLPSRSKSQAWTQLENIREKVGNLAKQPPAYRPSTFDPQAYHRADNLVKSTLDDLNLPRGEP